MNRFSAALALAAVLTAALSCSPARPEPQPLHPAFTLDRQGLEALVAGLPEASRARIMARPEVYLDLMGQALQAPRDLLVLVDKGHALSSGFAPADLVSLGRYDLPVSRRDLKLRRLVMPDLLAMVESARAAGLDPVVSSAYRSYEYQEGVYARNVREMGQEAADRESARPGHSQHQLGTTMDLGSIDPSFAATPAGRWMAAEAWKYGFSLSYPEGGEAETGYRYEPWHFRYLGRPAARLVREFFLDRQQLFLEYWTEKSSAYAEKIAR